MQQGRRTPGGKRTSVEILEEQNAFLDHWDRTWAATRIHGTERRQMQPMFEEERAHLQPLPVVGMQYFTEVQRTVCDDSSVRIDHSSSAARPAPIGSNVLVRLFERRLEICDLRTQAAPVNRRQAACCVPMCSSAVLRATSTGQQAVESFPHSCADLRANGEISYNQRMPYAKDDFVAFSGDSGRVIANLETAYEQWLEARVQLNRLPVSMFWKTVGGTEYLAIKETSHSAGTTCGARSPDTERQFEQFHTEKVSLKQRITQADDLISSRTAQYRALRLPVLPDRQGELLRALDVEGLLRNDVMVVGTNAFCAYELLCNAKFPTGNEETEDFDLAWCRGTGVSLASIAGAEAESHKPLLTVLQAVDSSYKINPQKRYQAVASDGYEVELLAAPSLAPLPKSESFEPMYSLVEQEWLLRGRPVSFVVSTVRRRACPIYVPDPRWMALHKLWLSNKPERKESKKPKDRRQGEVLLDACRHFLRETYPIDIDFVLELPSELRELFNNWATKAGFDPTDPDSTTIEPTSRPRPR